MVVGVLRIKLYVRQSRSLKEKRHVLQKIKGKISHHFNVSVAEIGQNDDWKTILLGISMVGNDSVFVHSVLHKVLCTIEGLFLAEVLAQNVSVNHYKDDNFFRLEAIPK